MLEANFWQDKSRSKKILKEKKLFEDLTNTYKNSEKNLADFKELYKLAIDESNNDLLIELTDNLKIGGAGVISATTNFSGLLAKKVYDDFKKTGSSTDDEKLKDIRSAFDESGNLITALHTLKSIENKAYANLLPPLELLNENKKHELIKKLKGLGVLNNKNMAA